MYCKTPTWAQFKGMNGDTNPFMALNDESEDFKYKNISIPHSLTLTFIKSPEKDPVSITSVFMNSILTFNVTIDATKDDEQEESKENNEVETFSDRFTPEIQFCYDILKAKITSVVYFCSQKPAISNEDPLNESHIIPQDKSDSNHRGLSDKEWNRLSSKKESDENGPGFKKLEAHSKVLILNTSTKCPFNIAASPTGFLSHLLKQKDVYKAEMALDHHLKLSAPPST